jgi:hypothetical protein
MRVFIRFNKMHVYEVRPRQGKREVDLISDVLPFGRLWYTKVGDAVEYATFYSRSHDAVIRVYDDAGSMLKAQARTRFHRTVKNCRRKWLETIEA